MPWIPISATTAIAKVIQPRWVCWEIGAGMSTLWLSKRVAHLTSIEANKDWFDRLSAIIAERNIRNIDLRHNWTSMNDFDGVPDGSLDFLLIDGGDRNLCLENGYAKVKQGGFIYLDNWDDRIFWFGSAEFIEKQRPFSVQCFVDYVPAMVGVCEGLLLRL